MAHEQITGEVITDERMGGQVIASDHIDEESIRHLMSTHPQTGNLHLSMALIKQTLIVISNNDY